MCMYVRIDVDVCIAPVVLSSLEKKHGGTPMALIATSAPSTCRLHMASCVYIVQGPKASWTLGSFQRQPISGFGNKEVGGGPEHSNP